MKTPLQPRPSLAYSFTRHLQVGETLLWQGKPVVSAFVWPKTLRDAFLIAPFFVVFMWLETLRPGTAITVGSPAFIIITLLAFVGGTWVVFRETRLQAEMTCYALTDRRVLIRHLVTLPTQEKRIKVEDVTLGRLTPRLHRQRKGVGSITFGLSPFNYVLAFRAIPEAAVVFHLLTQAQAALPQKATEMPYYVKSSKIAPCAFDITEHLRKGEEVLWHGAPNRMAYLRRIVPPEGASAVFLVALFGGLLMAMHGTFTVVHFSELVILGALICVPLVWWAYGLTVQRLSYFVTNQRVIIVKAGLRGVANTDERELLQTSKMRLVHGRNSTGTIVFEKHSKFIWHGQGGSVHTTEFSFKSIDDAQVVMVLVMQARARRLQFVKAPEPAQSSTTI